MYTINISLTSFCTIFIFVRHHLLIETRQAEGVFYQQLQQLLSSHKKLRPAIKMAFNSTTTI